MRRWKAAAAVIALALAGSGCTTIVRSSVASNGAAADAESQPVASGAISDNGRYVVFVSHATNLVANDTNAHADVFRHDNQTGTTLRVSVTNAGGQVPGDSNLPVLSGDADHVAFVTSSSLEPADTNGKDDVYVRNIAAGTTQRVSIRPDGSPVIRPDVFGAFSDLSISSDGRFVAMLNSGPGFGEIFLRDRNTATTTFPNDGSAAAKAILSDDGTQLVWNVACTGGPCPGLSIVQPVGGTSHEAIENSCGFRAIDTSDDARFVVGVRFGIYPMFTCPDPVGLVRWDRTTHGFAPIPVDSFWEASVSMSDNGRFVAALGQDGVARAVDMNTGKVRIADADAIGNRGSAATSGAAISGTGRYLAFSTSSPLVSDDTNGFEDVFTRYAIHPVVKDVAPGSIARGASNVTLTVTGTELLSGLGASISGSGITIHSVNQESTTSAKIVVSVAADAPVGARDVTVINQGGFGHSDDMCSACLTIT